MTIGKCPKCQEEVTVPGNASRQAEVRCPWCAEQYLLGDLLAQLPPALVVVHDPDPSPDSDDEPSLQPIHRIEPTETAPLSHEAHDFSFNPVPQAAPAFKFESSPVPAARASSSPSSSSRSRPRKKQAGAGRLIVQTIGGGVLGLLIAQLILWWMPGKWDESNRDPFGMAAKVSPYAPFLVPATLRTPTATAQTPIEVRFDQNDEPSRPSTAAAPGNGGLGSGAFGGATEEGGSAGGGLTGPPTDSTIPSFTFDPNANDAAPAKNKKSKNADAKKKKKEPTELEPIEPAIPATDPLDAPSAPTTTPDPFDLPDLSLDPTATKSDTNKSDAKMKADDSDASKSATPATIEAPASPPAADVSLKNAPELSSGAIPEQLAQVEAATRAWDEADNPPNDVKRDLIVNIYDQLARLGDAVAVAKLTKEAEAASSSVAGRLAEIGGQADKLSPLGILAGIRLGQMQNQGAVLYGTVVAHTQRGKLYETQFQLIARNPAVVSVVSTTDLAETLPVGASALLIGRMVAGPQENLTGYEGDAESVLLHGEHAVIK